MQLMMLGDVDQLDTEIEGFLLRVPKPSSTEVSTFLQLYTGEKRNEAARRLIAHGVPTSAISNALSWLDTAGKLTSSQIKGGLTIAAAAANAYHGYRRNNSIVWGVVWFACGTIFPIFTSAIALAQGFAKEK